jgi:hypothetical protein
MQVKQKKEIKQAKQKRQYDQHAKSLTPLKKGDTVRMKPRQNSTHRQWEKAKVQDEVDIRSYKVITEDGRVYRRNRKHLKQTQEIDSAVTVHTNGQDAGKTTATERRLVIDPGDQSDKQNQPAIAQGEHAAGGTQTNAQTIVRRSTRVRSEPMYMQDYVKDY